MGYIVRAKGTVLVAFFIVKVPYIRGTDFNAFSYRNSLFIGGWGGFNKPFV
jgi:hypothetical protein